MKIAVADTRSLDHLSTELGALLQDPKLLSRADVEIVLADGGGEPGGAVVPAHSCFLAARSPFLYDRIISLAAGGGKQRLELRDLIPGGGCIGRDALVAVLGYMYTGRFEAPPQKCVDDVCWHGACRPAIDFVVESMYAASGFRISALESLCQRRLSEFVDMDVGENIIPIIHVAFTCKLSSLLDKSIQRFTTSTLNQYLGKQLPGGVYSKIKDFCPCPFVDEVSGNDDLIATDRARTVRNIHKALYSDNVDLVRRLLKESAVTLDEAFAVHYAAAYCRPKVLAELLKLYHANVNLKDSNGYTPLHIACMRQEPDIILSLLERGASVLESTPDRRDSLTICKRLTREKGYNKDLFALDPGNSPWARHQPQALDFECLGLRSLPRPGMKSQGLIQTFPKLEKGRERRKDYLCIDILEQELERELFILHSICKEETTITHLLNNDRLKHLEIRVGWAKFMFPSEAMLAMRVAEADSTEDFTKTNIRKRKEVSSNENSIPQNNRLRFDALAKTVEVGRRYFPNRSKVLDEFLESGTAEDWQIKGIRYYYEQKDKAAAAPITSTGSPSSSTSRSEMVTPGGNPSQDVDATTGSANTPPLPFGLCSQAAGTADTSAGQLESRGSDDVLEVNRFCVGPKRKLKSTVWNEIERVNDWEGKCRWCNKSLSTSTKNGTTHLQRHLNSCQPRKAAKGDGGT